MRMTLDEIMATLEKVAESLRYIDRHWETVPVANDDTLDAMEKVRTDTLDDINSLTEQFYLMMLQKRART